MPPLACLGLGAPGRHRCFIFVGNPAMFEIRMFSVKFMP